MADVAAMDIVLGAKVDGATGGLKTVQKELGETATAAVKLDSTLDATSKSLTNIGGIAVKTAKSFDSVAAEVFSAADAFNAKWNPVVQKATTEAEKATTQVNTLAASFAKMGAGLRTTANYGPKFSETLKQIPPAAASATQAMINLGRIVQDAPYGFIGIANNINPMLESFQRLKAETGTTGGAIKALVGSLAGGAGLGLAVSVITSLLVVFGDKLFSSSKAVDEAKKANDNFAKSLNDVKSGAISTGLQLQNFINIAKDGSKPLSERNEALKEANKIMGEHGEKLTLANIATKAITDQTNLFTQALINQAVAAKYADRAADLIIKQTELSRDYGKALDKYNKAQAEANALSAAAAKTGGGFQAAEQARRAASVAYGDLVQAATNYKNVRKDEIQTETDANIVREKAVAALGKIGTKTKETTEKQKKSNEFLKEELDLHNKIQESLKGLTIADLYDKIDLNQLQNITLATKEQNKALAEAIKLQKEQTKEVENAKKAQDELMMSKMSDVLADLDKRTEKRRDAQEEELKGYKETAATLQKIVGPAFDDIFNTIAEGGNVFETLGHSLKRMIVQMASAAATAAILAAILSAIPGFNLGTVKNPITGFAGIFKSLFHFQHGGIITGPTVGLIGEAGPEVVFPLDRLREFIQPAQSQVVVLETRVRGSDIWLSQLRTGQRRGRTY